MNNTISPANNISFSARYLRVNNTETIPKDIYYAIYKSDGIDEFLHSTKPKTIFGKLMELFQPNEFLDVYYGTTKTSPIDKFAKEDIVHFSFTDKKKNVRNFIMKEKQKGVRRAAGIIPKPGEDPVFKAPIPTSTEKLAEKIEQIESLDSLLK